MEARGLETAEGARDKRFAGCVTQGAPNAYTQACMPAESCGDFAPPLGGIGIRRFHGKMDEDILRSHVETCKRHAFERGKPAESMQKTGDLTNVFARHGRQGRRYRP